MTPQEEDDVRRLLADARHTEPIPDDVAARLDRALASLADDPVPGVATVTPLAQRRRNAGRLLVAAAAVVLVGVGVGQVLDGTTGGADGESATAERGAAYDSPEAVAPGASDDAAGGATAGESAPDDRDLRRNGIARLRSESFATDVTELSGQFLTYAARSQSGEAESGGVLAPDDAVILADGLDAAAVTCRADSWGRGRFVAVRYDRVPAVLVFRRADGDTRIADLYLCGSTTPERSVTLPAP